MRTNHSSESVDCFLFNKGKLRDQIVIYGIFQGPTVKALFGFHRTCKRSTNPSSMAAGVLLRLAVPFNPPDRRFTSRQRSITASLNPQVYDWTRFSFSLSLLKFTSICWKFTVILLKMVERVSRAEAEEGMVGGMGDQKRRRCTEPADIRRRRIPVGRSLQPNNFRHCSCCWC